MESLKVSQKALAKLRDLLDTKTIERSELQTRQEVRRTTPSHVRSPYIFFFQRLNDQLSHAKVKLERAQNHAEDKKSLSQKTIERLQQEYDNMVVERRENDRQIEEVRQEANDVEMKVRRPPLHGLTLNLVNRFKIISNEARLSLTSY